MFALGRKDSAILLLSLTQLAQIKFFLLCETPLMELKRQDGPNQGRRKDKPGGGIDREQSAPSPYQQNEHEKHNVHNQRNYSYVFRTPRRYCHFLFPAFKSEQKSTT
ncbi:hypothetical protein ES703_28169 [subsurface metagenome]